MQRSADCCRSIDCQIEVDCARNRSPQPRYHGFDPVGSVDDVGTRLPIEKDQNCRAAIGEPLVAQIFDRVDHLSDIGQPYRGAISITDNKRAIILGMVSLIIGIYLEPTVAVFDRALGAMGIGRSERGANIFEPDPVFEQG